MGTSLKTGRRPSKKLLTMTSETTLATTIEPTPRIAARSPARAPPASPRSSTRAGPVGRVTESAVARSWACHEREH